MSASPIGELRHRVVVENPTRVKDTEGGYTDTWAAASPSPVWARIAPATARAIERQAGAKIEGPIDSLVTMRYHAGVSTETRLTFGTRKLFVRGVQNVDERDRYLVLACEELT